ncbi:Nucleotide-binding universal stress protein, UspA family [Nocardioides sp. YR527]|uniref:universal stress protein n=1 Tax=Nocardioides sp. YR527 TaxID=1881028 RepID=UPI000880D316|nr:universal stress protein [Nocardioides sp. YR527]SDK53158.1 Nucleotide-binding universal stress protein, UspA family [Nocardioides sp. YR527]
MTTPAEPVPAAPVLVGILDPSTQTALLEHAGRLAATGGHPLRLVYVVQANVLFGDPILGLPGAMEPRSMIIDDSAVGRLAEQRLSEATARIRDIVDGAVEVTGELLRGHAAHVLIKESEGAHRVMLQRRAISRVRRVFTGSVSAHVAAHAHCPVTVVPEGWSADGRTGVVVGVGNDKTDDQVLAHGLDEASRLDEPVTVLHGLDLMALHGEFADHVTTHEWKTRAERYLADLIERARSQAPENARTSLEGRVLAEAPADALVAAGDAATLLVVGRASHLLAFPHLGGVTRALLREAACPVDVLPLPG